MMREEPIIEMGPWLRTAPGRYLLQWEQARLDRAVADAFGFHALQLGLPEMSALRANRMPHRWVASQSLVVPEGLPLSLEPDPDDASNTQPLKQAVSLHCEFDALPFPSASIDLAVLPHALELARDPHQTLREVERVLVPDGRIVVTGFNPASLWGLRQRAGRMRRGAGFGRSAALYLPRSGEFLGYWRLRDWMRLLGFEVEVGRFGCWRPPLRSDAWMQRFAWMDPLGDRWWPVLGSAYFLMAVKRVRGMRLVGLLPNQKRAARSAPAVAAHRGRATETAREEHAETEL